MKTMQDLQRMSDEQLKAEGIAAIYEFRYEDAIAIADELIRRKGIKKSASQVIVSR